MYRRPVFAKIVNRLKEPRRFIQVFSGPRQTGKTTLAQQVMDEVGGLTHYATADSPMLKDLGWLEQQWQTVRARLDADKRKKRALLVLDEIQKIPNWSETVKLLWDEDSSANRPLHVFLLGSSPLLVQQGLTESLAGRFEVLPITHWSFSEMRDAFGFDCDQYVYFGGYPGGAALIEEQERWAQYILDSLIETSISRDILLMTRVDKPALLRRLFELGCLYSGQILSYQKMVGRLQQAGNTTTLAHYLDLLEGAGMLMGLMKYAGGQARKRASSPKLQVLNTGLLSAQTHSSFEETRRDHESWGRLVESTVGAHLANGIRGTGLVLTYWRRGNHEVDFVLAKGKKLTAIEVKSCHRKKSLSGLDAFEKEFGRIEKLLVGARGIPLEEFLNAPIETWCP